MPVTQFFRRELPYLWQDAYLEMTPRETSIVIFTHGTFEYVYDDYATLEATGVVEADDVTEARLVGATGFSKPNIVSRRHDDGQAFGQSGGGVEAYLARAVSNAQRPPVIHKPLSDE